MTEYVCGSLAGALAGVFTNPLDVVKTRLQLQGELKARGQHTIHYKNTLHAFYIIAKSEGVTSLQKGLVSALWFQVFLNGIRLGTVGTMESWGWTKKDDQSLSLYKMGIVSSLSGCAGSFIGSPFYLVKIHRQSQAAKEIAVGYQHKVKGILSTFSEIYKTQGLQGLWRGSLSSVLRVGVGSCVQLSTFSLIKELLEDNEILAKEKSLWNSFLASMCSGGAVAFFMTPFDVVQTRMYNQGLDKSGKGLLYSGILDCFIKTAKTEGVFGFFKGIGPSYFRIGPHSLLSLVFWDILKKLLGS